MAVKVMKKEVSHVFPLLPVGQTLNLVTASAIMA